MSATAATPEPQERAAWSDAPSQAEMACANERALLGCPKHHFTRFREGRGGSKRSRWRCERCGGEALGAAVRWYCYGLAHGRGERAA